MFKHYKNIDKDSNVDSYESGPNYIKVKFFDGSIYTYSYNKAGVENVEEMKRLADSGDGLNSYIMLHCRKLYD